MSRTASLALASAVAAAALWAGCASPLVGGECRPGFTLCDGRCVDLSSDESHCGSCDKACNAGAMCMAGACRSGSLDAGPDSGLDGGLDAGRDAEPSDGRIPWPPAGDANPMFDGAKGSDGGDGSAGDAGAMADGGDGGPGDGGTGDADVGDGGMSICDLGELYCDGYCIRPDTDRENCGGCGIRCARDEVCASGSCEPICEPPLELCGDVCIDTRTDPDHCGMCDRSCPTGICRDGECVSREAGHVVVVGHDYQTSRPGMNRVAGNAVFLPRGSAVDVLVYEGDAPMPVIRGVDKAIDQVADDSGRDWVRTETDAEEVPLRLSDADVFMVYSQHGATDAELRMLGEEWGVALRSFLARGGVVVLFDGGGEHEGTHQILDAAELFRAEGRTDVSAEALEVTAPGDAVAVGVPLSYRGERSTVRFDTMEETVVVAHPDGAVVVHLVVSP